MADPVSTKLRERYKALASLICSTSSRDAAEREFATQLEAAYREGHSAARPEAREAALLEAVQIAAGEEQAARSRRALLERELAEIRDRAVKK